MRTLFCDELEQLFHKSEDKTMWRREVTISFWIVFSTPNFNLKLYFVIFARLLDNSKSDWDRFACSEDVKPACALLAPRFFLYPLRLQKNSCGSTNKGVFETVSHIMLIVTRYACLSDSCKDTILYFQRFKGMLSLGLRKIYAFNFSTVILSRKNIHFSMEEHHMSY